MIIKLTPEQIAYATEIGKKRQQYNDSIGKKHAYGFRGNGAKIHIQGAIGEIAVAIALKEKWTAFSENYKKIIADVGKKYQVRSTDHPNGNLLLHPRDKSNQIFILAKLHDLPDVELCGWVKGKDAKNKTFWEDGAHYPQFKNRACYLYPKNKLHSIEKLLEDESD